MVDSRAVSAVYAAHIKGDVDYLIRALRDPEQRYLAAGYLGDSGDERAIGPLLPLLTANDPHLRATAARSLGALRAASSTQALADIAHGDPVVWVREWAIDALIKIPQADRLGVLLNALRDPLWSIRRLAIGHLAHLGERRALEPLRAAMAADGWMRRTHYRRAIRAIQEAEERA